MSSRCRNFWVSELAFQNTCVVVFVSELPFQNFSFRIFVSELWFQNFRFRTGTGGTTDQRLGEPSSSRKWGNRARKHSQDYFTNDSPEARRESTRTKPPREPPWAGNVTGTRLKPYLKTLSENPSRQSLVERISRLV